MSTDAEELEDDNGNKMDVPSTLSNYSSQNEETKSDPVWETLENNAENEDSSRNEEPSVIKGGGCGAESHLVLSYCTTNIMYFSK